MSLLKNHRYRIILLQTLCTYDVCGNLTTDGSNTYSYDELNRLSQITTGDGHVQHNRYDAEGLRHELEEDGRLVQFIYNHKGEVIAEESGEAGLIRYIRGLGIVSSDSEQAKTYYHYVCDYAGSTSHVLNEQGEVENEYMYDAFGNITASREKVPNRFCYTGEQYDRIPNQYYLRARYYNPVIGRFTQQDTYLGAGLNLYAYCGGNPLSYVDPSGHDHLSATDNAGNNYGCIQTPEALQQPSVQRMIDNYARTINDSAQKATDAMIKAVYGDDGVSGAQVQSAGTLSDINNGPESTALMVIDPPNSLVPAIYKPINTGGDNNPSTAVAPVAPMGTYGIVLYRNDAGTNPLATTQRSAVTAAVSDAGGPLALPGPTTRPLALPGPTTTPLALPGPTTGPLALPGPTMGQLALPAPSGTNPWAGGSEIIATRAPSDCYISMALSPGQQKPGGWGTFDNIPDVNYVRNDLAVIPEFKAEIGFVQRYLIPEGTPIQIGIVGPQESSGIIYPGGGNQVQILNYSDRAKLQPIGDSYEIH